MSAEILGLAERVEQPSGWDRNLDADIGRAIGLNALVYDYNPPAFTTSLDAAVSLIPEGWRVGVISEKHFRDNKKRWRAVLHLGGKSASSEWKAKTASLALTAAALRARASLTTNRESIK